MARMKSNTRKEILEAWDNGQKEFWFWDSYVERSELLGMDSISSLYYRADNGELYNYCSIEDPRPKKKTRPMTELEMAWMKGDKVVFGFGRVSWFTSIRFDNRFTHYAEILDKGKRLGPWKPLEVEE